MQSWNYKQAYRVGHQGHIFLVLFVYDLLLLLVLTEWTDNCWNVINIYIFDNNVFYKHIL